MQIATKKSQTSDHLVHKKLSIIILLGVHEKNSELEILEEVVPALGSGIIWIEKIISMEYLLKEIKT